MFAGYDAHARVNDALLFYLRALSNVGDIVLTLDCDLKKGEENKLYGLNHLLHVQAGHHGEYDFGSYKRGFMWAQNQDILKSYDYIYFVNDSVLGPTTDLESVLNDIESFNTDIVGMFYAMKQWVTMPENTVPDHIQSWFIGVKSSVATAQYFVDFITNIHRQESKADIIKNYEAGWTKILTEHGCDGAAVFAGDMDADPYRTPQLLLQNGVPFIKKAALKLLTPADLRGYVTPELLNIIKKNHLYKQKKWQRIKTLRIGRMKILTLKQRIGRNKTKWFLFDCIPLI